MTQFHLGDKVIVRGGGYVYGVGVIINFVQNKALVQFADNVGVYYIQIKELRHYNL